MVQERMGKWNPLLVSPVILRQVRTCFLLHLLLYFLMAGWLEGSICRYKSNYSFFLWWGWLISYCTDATSTLSYIIPEISTRATSFFAFFKTQIGKSDPWYLVSSKQKDSFDHHHKEKDLLLSTEKNLKRQGRKKSSLQGDPWNNTSQQALFDTTISKQEHL